MKFINFIRINILFSMISYPIIADTACTTAIKNYLREHPSTKSSITQILPRFTPLEIIEKKGNWNRVKGKRTSGWIHKSIISQTITCMIALSPNQADCTHNTPKLNRRISLNESFKILKKDIGCNFVQDRWNQRFWISTANIWPRKAAKRLNIKQSFIQADDI